MGLIRSVVGAAKNSVTSVVADQWKEFFYCDSISKDVLVTKGQKRVSSKSHNTGGDNIISNGSGIAVADGQCMIIVEQGKIVEVCAEPGQFTYDSSTEPSIFAGNLGKSIIDTFKTIGRRFTYGGDTAKDQRVYYFNTKEILDNKYGTANPVPFRVVDRNIGLDVDISIRCNGIYSYKIADPLLFYTNVCGNIESEYRREEIDSQLKSELLTALQPAFAKISDMGVRYSAIPGHTTELADALNEVLNKKWRELRGITIVSLAVNSVTANKEDEDMIKQLQKSAVMRDPTMAAARLVEAQSDAMRSAASNENGAMMGFMGLGLAQQAGGLNAQSLYQMGQQNPQQANQSTSAAPVSQPAQAEQKKAADPVWKCSCGFNASGNFCMQCGAKRPEDDGSWTCSCGSVNSGNFCPQCGSKKPDKNKCSNCGWENPDPQNPPKFCPECGNPFNRA